ncbi:hypothetical protein [Mycobacterium uberis]|uniref:hypothetical protein n=1 Tax=Mycobacterium uberis TaxID=2162698 RepID=UPI0010589345|nr:hypothetical protein [Mycobacterium uberis]
MYDRHIQCWIGLGITRSSRYCHIVHHPAHGPGGLRRRLPSRRVRSLPAVLGIGQVDEIFVDSLREQTSYEHPGVRGELCRQPLVTAYR